eukprot:5265995-Pyramimonas_sp.AAC.1
MPGWGLRFVAYADRRGCCLEVCDTDDHRVVRALQGIVDGQMRFWTHRPDHPRHVKVEHLLRCMARIRCLAE